MDMKRNYFNTWKSGGKMNNNSLIELNKKIGYDFSELMKKINQQSNQSNQQPNQPKQEIDPKYPKLTRQQVIRINHEFDDKEKEYKNNKEILNKIENLHYNIWINKPDKTKDYNWWMDQIDDIFGL